MTSRPEFITRFAPSPTGRLHLGHAFSALVAQTAAMRAGGRFLLRIEDIDQARCRPLFEDAVYQDLAWLGVQWERPVRRQSDHMADYQEALDRLQALRVLYRCFRTRKDLLDDIARAPHQAAAATAPGPLSPTLEAQALEAGKAFAWRLSLARTREHLGAAFSGLTARRSEVLDDGGDLAPITEDRIDASGVGDVIVARKELGVAYHLAVVVDDALQGITHVIRGADLRDALPVQRLLQALLQLPTPIYGHHRLILDETGERLAKRTGGTSLADLRAGGADPRDIRRSLGFET